MIKKSIVITISFLFCTNIFAQTITQRTLIKSKTNVLGLQQLAMHEDSLLTQRKIVAQSLAVSQGKPVSGVDSQGREFILMDYDSINGLHLHYVITNNG